MNANIRTLILLMQGLVCVAWVQGMDTNQSGFALLSANSPAASSPTNVSLALVKGQIVVVQPNVQQSPASNFTANTKGNHIPEVRFSEVPMTIAIDNLARISGFNCFYDPLTCKPLTGALKERIPQPLVTCHVTNVTPKEVLIRILNLRGFDLTENPVTTVARISRNRQPNNPIDARLLGINPENPVSSTNEIIPIIRLEGVPIVTGLDNLCRIANLKAEFDPRLNNDYSQNDPSAYLMLVWRNITAKQAIIAICENYNLTITRDSTNDTIRIAPRKITRHHHLRLR